MGDKTMAFSDSYKMDTNSEIVSFCRCPICGNDRLKSIPVPYRWIGKEVFEHYKGKIGLSQCSKCFLVFGNPQLKQKILDIFYQGNNYTCHDFANPGQENKSSFTLDFLEKHLGSSANKRLLDFGCGGGYFLESASRAGWKATGFDVGKEALLSCRTRSLKVTNSYDELRTERFDVITLNHVFEHISDPHGLLASLKDLLSDHGRILIQVPNAMSLRALLSYPVCVRLFNFDDRYRAFPIHLFYFTKKSLEILFEKHNFNIEAIYTSGMGIDELIYTEENRRNKESTFDNNGSESGVSKKLFLVTSLKRKIRDWFLSTGLGESICVLIGMNK